MKFKKFKKGGIPALPPRPRLPTFRIEPYWYFWSKTKTGKPVFFFSTKEGKFTDTIKVMTHSRKPCRFLQLAIFKKTRIIKDLFGSYWPILPGTYAVFECPEASKEIKIFGPWKEATLYDASGKPVRRVISQYFSFQAIHDLIPPKSFIVARTWAGLSKANKVWREFYKKPKPYESTKPHRLPKPHKPLPTKPHKQKPTPKPYLPPHITQAPAPGLVPHKRYDMLSIQASSKTKDDWMKYAAIGGLALAAGLLLSQSGD
jgi:hypothetical protein